MPAAQEKIKIMRVIARLNIGGPAIQAILLSTELNHPPFSTLLVTGTTGKYEGDMNYLAQQYGVAPVVIPELGREINWQDDRRSFQKLWRLIRQYRPQIVHTHTAKAGLVGRLAARCAGVPIIIHTFHGHIFHSYFGHFKTALFLFLERALARITDRIVAISNTQLHELCSKYHIAPKEKFALIPLGFPLEPFCHCEIEKGKLRAKLGLSYETPLVGIVGRLVRVKNHALFLQAAQLIVSQTPEVRFVIVGDGELKAELLAKAEALGLREHVFFLGWQKEMTAIYADLDLVVLTSFNEGTPVSLIEALACGKAVVATNVGGVADIVRPRETGLLVPSNDPEALTQGILTLLAQPSLRKKMGEVGRKYVRKQFSQHRLIDDISKLYQSLM